MAGRALLVLLVPGALSLRSLLHTNQAVQRNGTKHGGSNHTKHNHSKHSEHRVRRHGACPDMPQSRDEWEDGYLWAVFVDGKDAKQGPHVYDWDRNFFYRVSEALSKIYDMEGTAEGEAPLDIDMVERFRLQVYPTDENIAAISNSGENLRTLAGFTAPWMVPWLQQTVKQPPTQQGDYGSPHHAGGNEIMPQCTDLMSCQDVKDLLMNIPTFLYRAEHPTNDTGCPKGLHARQRAKTNIPKREILETLIKTYNEALKVSFAKGDATKDELLDHLVTFARSFAFLHPFENGNGRLRNVLLQRELRRLKIGCGTMMYNYNKDAFVDGFPRYKSKVMEGLKLFDKATSELFSNPWLNKTFVRKHEAKFETISGLEKCASSKSFGSGGTIK